MAVKSSLKNMTLCLTAVCLFCSAVLGVVYYVTKEPIEEAALAARNVAVGKVLPDGAEVSEKHKAVLGNTDYVYFEGMIDGEVVAYAVESSATGFGGPVVVMVGLLPDGTVINTSVIDASGETPGLGAKCVNDPKFTSQWKGFEPGKKLLVKKDGGDVDAITAATITSRAYVKAVAAAREIVNDLVELENE